MNTDTVGGRFQIIKPLGGGSFGQTYLAEDLQYFGRRCVVKHLRPVVGSPESFGIIKGLFEREARSLDELGHNHPQIPSLIAYFEEDRQLYLVQEFIEGQDLSKELIRGKKLSELEAIALLEDILKPLAFLHENNYIHRDIKPSNLMRRQKDAQIVLIDFGAIKEVAQTEVINSTGETRVGTIIGTPGYMPSEQALGNPKFASDIYAVGIVTIQALTGLPPSELKDPETEELVWSNLVRVTPQLKLILETMVAYHVKQRYRKASDVLEAVFELKESSPTSQNDRLTTTVRVDPIPEKENTSSPSTPERTTSPISYSTITARPSSARETSTPPKPKTSSQFALIQRRGLLKLAILGGAGVGIAVVGGTLFDRDTQISSTKTSKTKSKAQSIADSEPDPNKSSDRDTQQSSTKRSEPQLNNFSFELLTVNASGQLIARSSKQTEYFTEDLGNGVVLKMVAIPGGKFIMGTKYEEIEQLSKKFNWSGFRKEKPQHEVSIQPFFMSKFQVTQAQWKAVANQPKVDRDLNWDPSRFKGDNRPIENISWEDAVEFCKRLSKETQREYRLPSEAEWEYACRAGTTTPFHFGETITSELANYNGNYSYAREPKSKYRMETTIVGSFPPNAFGLYDMHGNVWEWCQDDWHDNYEGAPRDGRAWYSRNKNNPKVRRGGSWNHLPFNCRSAYRSNNPYNKNLSVGLRLVRVATKSIS